MCTQVRETSSLVKRPSQIGLIVLVRGLGGPGLGCRVYGVGVRV